MWLVHEPSATVTGTAGELNRITSVLEAMTEAMVSRYVKKTKQDPESIRALMRENKYINAKQAYDFGFVDEVSDFSEYKVFADSSQLQSKVTFQAMSKTQETDWKLIAVQQLTNHAIATGKIEESQKEAFEKLAVADFQNAANFLNAASVKPSQPVQPAQPATPAAQTVPAQTVPAQHQQPMSVVEAMQKGLISGNAQNERESWTWDDWSRKDTEGLLQMKANDPAKFESLFKKHTEKWA